MSKGCDHDLKVLVTMIALFVDYFWGLGDGPDEVSKLMPYTVNLIV